MASEDTGPQTSNLNKKAIVFAGSKRGFALLAGEFGTPRRKLCHFAQFLYATGRKHSPRSILQVIFW